MRAYSRWVSITAAAADLAGGITDGIYVGTSGNITVTLQGGDSITIAVIAGTILPIKAQKVTAGTGLFALYF